jgi:predicted Zn-dependent protease
MMLNAAISMKPEPIPPGIPIKPEDMEARRNDSIKSHIELCRTTYPNNPAIELLATTFYVKTKQYPLALAAVDTIDKSVGGDPYLDVTRAQIYMQTADSERAAQVADTALTKVPELLPAYEVAACAAAYTGKYDRSVEVLDQMYRKFGVELSDDLKTDPNLRGLLKSPSYLDWKSKLVHAK